ncbi:MAG: HEAT repeat domain-containing protein [Planctomycetota bacterium]|nr:HEAT repeat domain-containing protein [Planctomycetota bacterium]
MSFAPFVVLLALAAGGSPAPEDPRYVLHLADGRIVRAEVRIEPAGYSVRKGAEWTLIPSADVLRATPLREVEQRLAEMRKASASGDPARVEVAHAALGEGMLDDAIAEIDAVLARDPDQVAARAFVAQAPLALTLPAAADRSQEARLCLFGARALPAYRELAAARLAEAPRELASKELARALASPSPNLRAFAAFALRRLDPASQADALVRRAVVDPSERVRIEAARALRDARDESLVQRVAAALELDDARLRNSAAAALGEMGHPAALPALAARLAALQASGGHPGGTRAHLRVGNQLAYVKDFNPEIAQGASIADPIVDTVEEGTVLDVRVGGTSVVSVQDQRRALCTAMQRISGVDLPLDAPRWLAWWEGERLCNAATPAATPATR